MRYFLGICCCNILYFDLTYNAHIVIDNLHVSNIIIGVSARIVLDHLFLDLLLPWRLDLHAPLRVVNWSLLIHGDRDASTTRTGEQSTTLLMFWDDVQRLLKSCARASSIGLLCVWVVCREHLADAQLGLITTLRVVFAVEHIKDGIDTSLWLAGLHVGCSLNHRRVIAVFFVAIEQGDSFWGPQFCNRASVCCVEVSLLTLLRFLIVIESWGGNFFGRHAFSTQNLLS